MVESSYGNLVVFVFGWQGEKVFYLIPPTPTNLRLYEKWMLSPNQPETFFADLVDVCYSWVVSVCVIRYFPAVKHDVYSVNLCLKF